MELIGPVLIVSHLRFFFFQNAIGKMAGAHATPTLCTALPAFSVCKAFSKDIKKCKETRDACVWVKIHFNKG